MLILKNHDIEITVRGKRFLTLEQGQMDITSIGTPDDDWFLFKCLLDVARKGMATCRTAKAQIENEKRR